MPATVYDSISAGPPTLCAAAPVATKMPAPMMAPMPRLVSWIGPSTRRRRCSPFISSSRISRGFLVNRLLMSPAVYNEVGQAEACPHRGQLPCAQCGDRRTGFSLSSPSQIGLLDPIARQQRLRRILHHDPPRLHHVAAMGGNERHVRVL